MRVSLPARQPGTEDIELAGETVRAALEALAVAVPQWLASVIDDSWADVYSARIDNLRLPESQTKRDKLIRYGTDGYRLLDAVHEENAPGWLVEIPMVQALRQIWIQQFYRDVNGARQEVRRREHGPDGDGVPPGRDRIISPYDLDARYSIKRDTGWDGRPHARDHLDLADAAGSVRPGQSRARLRQALRWGRRHQLESY